MTRRNGALFDGFYLHMSPSVIITGIGMFLLFRHVDFGRLGKRFRAVVMFFSRYSYGIYLAHVLVPWGLYDIGVYHSFINPALGIPLTAVICFAASAFLVWGINKVPLGKYISG